MAQMRLRGFVDFINLCVFTNNELDRIAGRSIHPGGKIMADGIRAEAETIRVDDGGGGRKRGPNRGYKRNGPTSQQKAALLAPGSYGIAKIRHVRHGWNVKVGWQGYNDVLTKKYPRGQANAMIARSVNAGTTFMKKQPFVNRAIRKYERATVQAISDQFDEEIEKIWNKGSK